MNDRILKRVLEKAGVAGLDERIANALSFSELQSLLLAVVSRKSRELTPRRVYDQFLADAAVRPSPITQTEFLRFDSLAASLLSDAYSWVELSPVSPLGCCSVVAPVSQERIVSTIRKTEVASDPTNVLALEAASRRKGVSAPETVRLATSHRVLRAERVLTRESRAHFRLLSACIAGRAEGDYGFEIASTFEFISFHGRLLEALRRKGYAFSSPEAVVYCRDEGLCERMRRLASPRLRGEETVSVSVKREPREKWNYYATVRFNLFIERDGERFFIADGGDTDWTQRWLGDRRERFLTSGFGSERFLAVTAPGG